MIYLMYMGLVLTVTYLQIYLLYSVASCYCQSLRKIHVRIESLLIINFELTFQSHTAYYLLLWKSKIAFRDP